MKQICYPIRGRRPEDVFTQELVEQLAHRLELWQQGPGVFGSLHLHGCWGQASVLDKRYQGESVCTYNSVMEALIYFYDHTKEEKWRIMANNLASNILFLQTENGGFRHASNEFEPTFSPEETCPIHQGHVILGLLYYAGWAYADESIRARVKPAIDRHWDWFLHKFWLRGNGGVGPFPGKAGYCGVTNQDLTIVWMLAEYGHTFGEWERYNTYGKPCLDDYLSDLFYYKEIGLFERGDHGQHNFCERTHYNGIILGCLEAIYQYTADPIIPPVIENVTAHLFDAAFIGEDGCQHLAWGAETDPDDKTFVKSWIKAPITPSYLPILHFMELYLKAHPDEEKQKIYEGLVETFCAYVYSDGSYPISFKSKNPYFSIVSRVDWDLLTEAIRRMGDNLQPLKTPADLCIHRRTGDYTWKQKGEWWVIEEKGVRQYGGYTRYMAGVTIGPDEEAITGSYAILDECDLEEIVEE